MAYAPQSAIPWMANACTRPKAGPSSSFGGTFVGAYAIRPYMRTRKCATFSTSHPIASPKGSLFFVSHPMVCPERDAFFTCYNRETIQRAAFYVFHRMTCPDMCRVRIYCNRGTIEKRCVSRIPRHGMISTRCGWGMRRRGMGRGGKISCLVTSEKS